MAEFSDSIEQLVGHRDSENAGTNAFPVGAKKEAIHGFGLFRRAVAHPLRALRECVRRVRTTPLESLPDAPDLFSVYRGLLQAPGVERRPGGWVYKGKFYPDYLTVGGASHATFGKALKLCSGEGVDIGAGLWPLPGAKPVDVCRGPGLGKSISHFGDGTLDYVFSSHCLEHIENWKEALRLWVAKLKPGGVVFLYLPHPECSIWHRGSPFVGDGHKWIPTPDVIQQQLADFGCEVIYSDEGPDAMFSFSICSRKTKSERQTHL